MNQTIDLDKQVVFHLKNVLKTKPFSSIRLVDPQGNGFVAQLDHTCTKATTKQPIQHMKDLRNDITLIIAMIKKERLEWTIQKATELGVSRIVLLETNRCVVKINSNDVEKKLMRFHTIAKEASEQSHRLTIPQIVGPVKIDKLNHYLSQRNIVLYEKTDHLKKVSIDPNIHSYSVVIGPEGGFNEEEVIAMENLGFVQASLTHRILRSETAALMACILFGGYYG